jgi:glutamate---cysteine ligase / carboxylate-amine ligase
VLVEAAAQLDAAILASGTHPVAVAEDSPVSAGHRYRWLEQAYSATALGTLVCGCHVHVAVPDRAAGVAVLDRVRPWLAPLLAVSANSPLWHGADTGYASWREQEWKRWPTSGPTGVFGSLAAYEDLVRALVASGSALDERMLYFDARLSATWPTVEVRVADVCLDVEDVVLVAALARALVTTALRDAHAAAPAVPVEVLRSASWVASRHGTSGPLLDPVELRSRPAEQVLTRLQAHVRDALDDAGDTALVGEGLDRVLRQGTGAAVQRAALDRGGLSAVLDAVTLG